MVKKSKKLNKAEKSEKIVSPYSEQERNNKITKILFQLASINFDHVIDERVRKHINDFIKNGTNYKEIIDLPAYSREMDINLINDKTEQTYINLKFKRIRIEGEPNNPINKLNEIQERIL